LCVLAAKPKLESARAKMRPPWQSCCAFTMRAVTGMEIRA
jgi:hypothetical protein